MASDKKPSMYSGRRKVGSTEELETYGVWVKSEPQDFTASLAEAANFDADALPYDADFDAGFDDMGGATAGFDLFDSELNIPEMSVEDDIGGFGDGSFGDSGFPSDSGYPQDSFAEQGGEETSTRMLRKIADELSSIRSELNTLKKEFAEIRGDSAFKSAGEDEEDEKTALTGDEMDNLFASADFPSAEEIGFDPKREADEAALKELAEQNEAEEEIHIDFDNLDIGAEEEPLQELPPLEDAAEPPAGDDDFEMPSFEALSFDEAPALGELEEGVEGFAEELVPLEEDRELEELRLEGAESLASPPENADYLEEDPFANDSLSAALDESALDESALSEDIVPDTIEEPVLEEPTLEESVFVDIESVQESAQPEAAAAETTVAEITTAESAVSESADLTFEDLSFDESSFDLGLDDFSAEPSPELSEPANEPVPEESSLDLSDAVIDEPVIDEPVIDELDLSDTIVEPPLEEPVLNDIAFGESISLDDDFGADIKLDTGSLEPLAEEPLAEEPAAEEPAVEELAAEEPAAEDSVTEEIGANFDLGAIELDAKDDSAAEEEIGVDIDGSDIDLELDAADDFAAIDLQADIESPLPEIEDTDLVADKVADKVTDKVAAPANDIISDVDDSIAQVIPEGFEVNAKEADASLDDDLEAFADEELSLVEGALDSADTGAITAETGDEFSAIPPALKNELKNVLSYMDHLLESLPEEKIEEFAQSEYFDKYKKIFKELGLV